MARFLRRLKAGCGRAAANSPCGRAGAGYRLAAGARFSKQKLLAYPFMLLGLSGFLVSLYVHIAAWFGQIVLPQSWLLGMHIGMFPPFFASMFLAPRSLRLRRHVRSDQAGNFLNTAMMVVLFYALANFGLGMLILAFHHGQMPPVQQWKLFSGHWMLFYFWSFAILYQAVHPEQKVSVLS